jgi:hypothetical protein
MKLRSLEVEALSGVCAGAIAVVMQIGERLALSFSQELLFSDIVRRGILIAG